MKVKSLLLPYFCLVLASLGCGGGGGSSNSVIITGFYNTILSETDTSCIQNPFNLSHEYNFLVEQSVSQISVTNLDTNSVYFGSIDDSDSFEASRTFQNSCSNTSSQQITLTLRFSNIDNNFADIALIMDAGNCTNTNVDRSCQATYRGLAQRN